MKKPGVQHHTQRVYFLKMQAGDFSETEEGYIDEFIFRIISTSSNPKPLVNTTPAFQKIRN